MSFFIGKNREARRAYGFDEVSIVPGNITANPDEVNIKTDIGSFGLEIPFLASAMDGVVDVDFAIKMGKLGAVAVLNVDGIQSRYKNPKEILEQIVKAQPNVATALIQAVYKKRVKANLISERIEQIKSADVRAVISCIPSNANLVGPIAKEAGADMFVVQNTVASAQHLSTDYVQFDYKKFCDQMQIPVVVGNVVSFRTALELMEMGCSGLLVGVGPGAACTSRGVLGIGVPQVTATIDCAAARDEYFKKTGKYVSVITDGGMSCGGDICKAFASGADAVMIGSTFAKAKEAPGGGFHWGMATPHQNLPRGTRIKVGVIGSLQEILFGPAKLDDGSQNLVGALRTSMASVGALNIKQMQMAELIIAPDIKHEGKIFQKAQKIGMYK